MGCIVASTLTVRYRCGMKKIILSKCAGEFLFFPVTGIDGVVVADDVNTSLESMVTGERDTPMLALVFVNLNEFIELKQKQQRKQQSRKQRNTTFLWKAIIMDAGFSYSMLAEDDVDLVLDCRASSIKKDEFEFIIKKGFSFLEQQMCAIKNDEYLTMLMDMKRDQEDLINIGRSLSLEKDSDKLLRTILLLSKKITGADAGSIYLVEENEQGEKQLRFKYSHTFSKEIPIEEFVMPLNKKSIAGYVALTGEVLNLADMYRLPENAPFSFNKEIDIRHHYRSKTMLAVPMRNHIDEIIGVIQLLNSKETLHAGEAASGNEAFEIRLETPEDFETKVVAFDPRYESLMEAVASQAAIAIENNRMIRQIESQFEEFVKASVHAIESRDKATSGHSFRVAELCKHMAYAINAEREGVFKDIHFTETEIKEIEYAGLLHDFGKVYIDLAVFMKGKKLYPKDFENLIIKINYLYRFVELQALLCNYSNAKNVIEGEGIAQPNVAATEIKERLESIRKIKELVYMLNEPTVTEMDPEEALRSMLQGINDVLCRDIEGNVIEIIDDLAKKNLSIRRGSLNEEERKEIESHVIHTYNFVSKIPWPPEFKNIPEIALKHHEKLDGTGYPSGLRGEEIPIQARMMAIADIYDALTASDRPYKKAISKELAIKILGDEARGNKIDPDLYDLFVRYKIFDAVDRDFYRTA